MSKSNVIQDIKSKIRPNGEQSITGQVLQDVLVESVNLVPEKVSELVNDSQYQTKANLDTALASKADTSAIPTKTSQLANDSGFVTSTEVSTTYATKAEVPTKTSQLTNDSTYQTKANLDTALATKADKSSLASKQDKLVSGTNIKTVNNQSILGSGNISIESTSITVDSALSTTSENPVQNKVITNTLQTKANASDIPTKVSQLENDSKFATQTAVATGLATKADKDSLTSLESDITNLQTTVGNQDKSIIANAQAIQGKQDKLVSGTNIKTINNQSILGSGNISIEGGGSAVVVDNALSDTSENPVQNKVITTRVTSIESSLASKANASDIPTKVSQLENDSTYQTKANLDTALADYAKTSDVNSKNALQDEDIQDLTDAVATLTQLLESKADTSAIPTKTSQLTNDSGFATTTNVSATYATKESVTALTAEVANKANASDIPTKTSQLENDSTYQTKANLDTALESYAKTGDVNSKNALQDEAIQSKQDKLVSGTNIKTINNQSLLGSGNISIESGTSITVDNALSTTSENPVQNKVITTKVNSLETSLGSKASQTDLDSLSSTVTTQGQTITSIQTEIGNINTQLTEING